MYFPPYSHLLLGEGGKFWYKSENALRFHIIQNHNTDSTSTDKHGGMASSYNVGKGKGLPQQAEVAQGGSG
jgi:hypothetical protein